ncbi:AraC family transcriptional regulator [Blautia sp. RD014234]|nr:AraC family transcriptional regulator [Blautia parvula]
MDWLQRINESIDYMETHLMEELSIEQISNYVFASKSNFQRVFHMVTGVTIGEYIRNRRLSLAGQDPLLTDNKVADIAQKYRYDTSESFSKAFLRFHSISPSDVKTSGAVLRFFILSLLIFQSVVDSTGLINRLMNFVGIILTNKQLKR